MLKIITNNWFILGASIILSMTSINIFKAQSIGSLMFSIGELTLKTIIYFIIFKLIIMLALKVIN
ncbi:hypothetical protein B4W72_12220 [Staphylococcus delphini]|uniref:hypothetical protein n=1 Tax=Staphylococcus delphini TaxID=53344 RepID=UPI000BBBA384|nr:hypothetical protein [Staphylococcus delphini]PCF70692.1 hypothetical protein B4W72_12220 [Staphylococcus delphini]PCF78262.1 hypothetical protein B4W69_13590 [Staphylococcus delphini]